MYVYISELCLGTYECLATKDYCRESVEPKVPAVLFAIGIFAFDILLCKNYCYKKLLISSTFYMFLVICRCELPNDERRNCSNDLLQHERYAKKFAT